MLSPAIVGPPIGGNVATPVSPKANSVYISLEGELHNVRAIYCTGYMIQGTGAGSNLWRVNFTGNNIVEAVRSNAAGQGFCIALPSLNTPVYQNFDTPKLMALCNKKGISSLQVTVVDEFGADVSFVSITLFLTFIMDEEMWDSSSVMRNDANNLNLHRQFQYTGRFKF